MYTRRLPSGDQIAPCSSNVLFWVRLVSAEPSVFMTYTSQLPSRNVLNAIFVPSGDSAG
jgi:hypothetical protein